MRVDDGRYAQVVDVRRPSTDALHADDALVLRFVCEHRSCDDVTDRVNTTTSISSLVCCVNTLSVELASDLLRDVSLEASIDWNLATFVGFEVD